MSYELSFSDIFFTCLQRALAAMPKEQWDNMGEDPDCKVDEYTDVHAALKLAREINTCDTIAANEPIGVYLDEQGFYMAEVMPLAHYVKHHKEICEDDDQALVFIHEEWCWCNECNDCPSEDWSREQLQEYLEGRGFAVYDRESYDDLLRAAREDWLTG